MTKWLKRMLYKKRPRELERRWTKPIDLLTHSKITKRDGSKMQQSSRA